jgi:hypothetical protein
MIDRSPQPIASVASARKTKKRKQTERKNSIAQKLGGTQ